MNPLIIQSLRDKLQRRVAHLCILDSPELFQIRLSHLLEFCEANPLISGVIRDLHVQFSSLGTLPGSELNNYRSAIKYNEKQTALISYIKLRSYAQNPDFPDALIQFAYKLDRNIDNDSKRLELACQQFLEPFYQYLDEQLSNESVILSLLIRYKHRSEWFCRKQLWNISQDETKSAERNLAENLYLYLFDQGVDFHIEPSSHAGKIDLIAAQKSDDPLLADAKIFDGESRGKSYICHGFNQIYTYTQQYNEPFGYLVVFKITDRDLHFSLSVQSRHIPAITYNNKTIFVLVIDIFDYQSSVSKRGNLKAVEITEQYLVENIRVDSVE